ncbi:MAG: 16S rRNA (adenine(1518)-N(6)/adenine(1519)-N(6))-dimethyltransferase RsmA [Limisphaerales bacterium]
MKLNEMREVLATAGIQLTKSLGQNFLHDQNQLRRIVGAAELSANDKALEIGPGLGPLTELLLEKAASVLAIEKDARLAGLLRERIQNPNLELLQADALQYLKSQTRDWRDWKMVSNLPYSVASPILVELACGTRAPKTIVATLQWEVARRLIARPGDNDYGILTLLVQLDYAARDLLKIPASCFFPAPDVDSAFVVLDRREPPLLAENLRQRFIQIVKRAFSQRRKMLFKLLRQDWPAEKLKTAFAQLRISPLERAENLSLEQFVKLAESV